MIKLIKSKKGIINSLIHMKIVRFKTNINCDGCIKSVVPFLNEVDTIDFWKVDTKKANKILEVNLDNDDIKIVIETVKKAGFTIDII